MGQRKRVGIFFSYDENWIGGAYYILNLIAALKLLPADQQPFITVFFRNSQDKDQAEKIGYPFIEFVAITNNMEFWKKVIRFSVRKISGKHIYKPSSTKKFAKGYFDAIFPAPVTFNTKLTKKIIHWIPDFQEAWLPHFFSEADIAYRKKCQQNIALSNDAVVFSSYDALKDFERLYPSSVVERHVMQFAVTHPDYNEVDFTELKRKYQLPDVYFFCPNQFWVHKNQKIVLAAIAKLKHQHNKKVAVVFSGKVYDTRNENYFTELEEYIRENEISDAVSFLGFIDRKDQLQIMKHALAVIQPSLFEGWSTVVEDVKAMNQNIIVSNLPVHYEQLGSNASYFDPKRSEELAERILEFEKTELAFNYIEKRIQFAQQFLALIN
jgi:glycosyltransferase involved in cell wall biosynthesis